MTKFLTLSGVLTLNLMFFSLAEVSARQAFTLGAAKSDGTHTMSDPLIPGKPVPRFKADEAVSNTDDPSLPLVSGDINGDGVVDGADLGIFLAHYGEEANGALANADFDSNGFLNHIDMVLLLDLIGSSSDSDGFR